MIKLTLAAALLGLATAALAQTPAATPAAGISFDQWAVKARERLMALDTDHDGRISRDEFAARASKMGKHGGGRMFDRFDTNKDGYLDTTEINAMLARRFARMDANHDGMLTQDERHAMRGMNATEQ
jgi:Ca2+-binding EF-hand superfamily protein